MAKKQKIILLILCSLSLIVLALFIAPDLQGAQNAEMISVFQPDEYAQYPYVLHMLTGGTLWQSIHSFLVYGHYYYGYPFYFFSGLALLPVKWILGAGWSTATATIMVVLRETINVLPMLIALLLLVWMATKFRSYWKSLLLFGFLVTLPMVTGNNLWWHPDSLLTLFCVLTLFFLQRDDLRFGKNFYFSAIACGMAISTKVLGVLFVTTYLAYLLYGIFSKRINFGKALAKAGIFLLILLATILISTPQLIMPQERAELIAVFKGNLSENTRGFWVKSGGITANWSTFKEYIRADYGGWVLLIIASGFAIAGLWQRKNRLITLWTTIWAATYVGYFIFIAATLRPHYFLPVLLPFFTLIAYEWEEFPQLPGQKAMRHTYLNRSFLLPAVGVLTLAVLLGIDGVQMSSSLRQTSQKESQSASIHFFNQVNAYFLSRLPTDHNFTFYRDWRAYVAPQSNWNVVMDWNLFDYSRVEELKPAVIFLEQENIHFFSNEQNVANALDASGMQMKYRFYTDAANNDISGYRLMEENDFGKAFIRQDMYDEFLANH
ncbi:MAG: hypothetical protein GYA58_02645 [Anaerolineaceae bacterium]|nr:hypothetical protein [Anaerolineaceae bacterium]